MNQQQAKEILFLYRPKTADQEDPAFAEALSLAQTDPDLRPWFEEHCASYCALRSRFKQIQVPEGFKEQILAERKINTIPVWRRPAVLITAAAVTVLLCIVSISLPSSTSVRERVDYSGYLDRMVSVAKRGYEIMDVASADSVRVRSYLAAQQAPANFTVPTGLHKAALVGCKIEYWQGAKVSMICFQSGNPLPPTQPADLWLFVIDRKDVSGAPSANLPLIANERRAATASWTQGDKTYLLVADGDEQFLKKYL